MKLTQNYDHIKTVEIELKQIEQGQLPDALKSKSVTIIKSGYF